eukprot:IDg12030t1
MLLLSVRKKTMKDIALLMDNCEAHGSDIEEVRRQVKKTDDSCCKRFWQILKQGPNGRHQQQERKLEQE